MPENVGGAGPCMGRRSSTWPGRLLGAAGPDLERVGGDRLFRGIAGILNQGTADVEALGIRQTPSFFLDGRRLENFRCTSPPRIPGRLGTGSRTPRTGRACVR